MKILITDKNRHVRALLARELRAEKLDVVCSCQADEISRMLSGKTPPDIVVIDPELYGEEQASLLPELLWMNSRTCCIMHVFNDFQMNFKAVGTLRKVVKSENSIEELRWLICKLAAEQTSLTHGDGEPYAVSHRFR